MEALHVVDRGPARGAQWDPNGHARSVMAPGGYVLEVDPSNGAAGMVAAGLRTQHLRPRRRADGEDPDPDSDMEWDLGSPWYRPTRLVELTSGADFGWRSGSGKFPVWREDMALPVADVGPGSPTGVLFGTGAAFPPDDQRALYLLDWTFGTIHRARLRSDGAGHAAQLEPFMTGRALPLTDAVIGSDGAMYLTTGGRRTSSHLLRVRYVGDGATEPATWPEPSDAARRRTELERAHVAEVSDAELDALLAALGDDDRRTRYAARVGLEHQELERWLPKLEVPGGPRSRVQAWLAALRATSRDDSVVDTALAGLGSLDPRSLDRADRLVWLRAHQWALIGRPEVTVRWRDRLVARLDPLYPSADPAADVELAILLVHLGAPRVVERTLDLAESAPPPDLHGLTEHAARNPQYGDTIAALVANPPPTEGMRFVFALRDVEEGWSLATRERWFRWVHEARRANGGVSFGGYLDRAEAQALATCDAETRLAIQPLLVRPGAGSAATGRAPRGPGRAWTVDEAEPLLTGRITGADFVRGAELFAFACSNCHRIGGSGGSVGPDLTSAATKFTLHDLLVAVLDPDANVSDQYRLHEFRFADGSRRIARDLGVAADGQHEYVENLLDPGAVGRVAPGDLVSVEPSPRSPMPAQLTHAMNAGELRDLVAHVASAGGSRRDLGAWQGVAVTRPDPPILSGLALRLLGGAVAVLAVLVVVLVAASRRFERSVRA
ncbi:MAG: c-type cytochrome [Planctomycetota bacterium]